LKPEYEKAATELKDKVPIAKVDCTVEKESCDKYGIHGFPTLKIFRDGTPSEYKGQRTAQSIVETMKRQMLPAVSVLSGDDAVKEFVEAERVAIVGYFKADSKEKKVFETVAQQLRDDFVFGATDAAEQKIVLHKKFDEGKNEFDGEFTEDAIKKFVQTYSVPIMDDIGPHNYEKYVSSGLPIAYFFYGTPEQRKELGPSFEKVAKQYQSKILFVYLDASLYGGHAENLALKQEWPAFGIQNIETAAKYPFDQTKDITLEAIEEFVKSFHEGKIEPTLKSEPIPETNDEPVKVVVGKTFEELVRDTEKDVLIEFYARIFN
jgi:protein disulfide-isomerase A1